jgi:hypothetical protein
MNQGVTQLPPAVVAALSQFGTKIVFNLPLHDDALYMARMLYEYDPSRVKKKIPVWMNVTEETREEVSYSYSLHGETRHYRPASTPTVIDHTTEEFSIDEQYELAAQVIQRLPTFHCLVKAAKGEGDLTGETRKRDFSRLINGHFPDAAALETPLAQLRKMRGVPLDQVLQDIDRRQHQAHIVPAAPRPPAGAILSGDDPTHDHPERPLPEQKRRKRRRRAAKRSEAPESAPTWQEDLWRDPT